jgi:glutathione-regulated potassium-efflux system ancillary protein KefG
MNKRILILFAHPALEKSRVNSILIEGLEQMEGITFHDLYQEYPEFDIDIRREQKLLLEHDIIVFHHPFYWYSTPAIVKEWLDLVLEHGWAYGGQGDALKGKWMINVTTTGGKEKAYCEIGSNRFTVRQLLAPMEQSACLCKMLFLPPFVVHGTLSITEEEILEHKQDLINIYNTLLNGDLEVEKIASLPRINADMTLVLDKSKIPG